MIGGRRHPRRQTDGRADVSTDLVGEAVGEIRPAWAGGNPT
jgi:hypothetical protein